MANVKRVTLTCLVAICAAAGFTTASWAANVAVFNDPDFVDVADESASIQASLTALGHTVTPFTGITAASFTAAMVGADLILFPHNEPNTGITLSDALGAAAIAALKTYVTNGGGVIAVGSDAHTLLSTLFYEPANTLASSGLFLGGSFIQPESVGSPFASAPAQLAALPGVDTGLNFFAFDPPDSLAVYADSVSGTAAGPFNSITVFADDIGAGNIAYLSWSWLNAVAGDANGGWNPLLDLAVQHVAAAPGVVPLPAAIHLLALGGVAVVAWRRLRP